MKKSLMSMKKVFALLLVVALMMSFDSAEVFASEDTEAVSKELKDRVLSAVDQAASTGKEGTFSIDGMSINLDMDYLVVDEANEETRWLEDKPKVSPQIEIGTVTLAHGIIFVPPERVNDGYPGTGQVLSLIYIYDISGIAPSSIQAEVDVNTDNVKNGGYSEDFSELSVDWGFFDIFERQAELKYQDVSATKFYQYEFNGSVNYYWFDSDDESETKGNYLANKKAFQYPCRHYDPRQTRVPQPCMENGSLNPVYYADPYSDKILYTPDTTLLQQVPPEQRVPWNNELRGEYIKQYIDTYGDPKQKNPNFDWGDYDIHHIIPREYGGTNDFGNLIPLKREFHSQNVTPWWTNY